MVEGDGDHLVCRAVFEAECFGDGVDLAGQFGRFAGAGFDLLAVGPALILAWFVVMITQAHSTQAVIQIGFAARDERHAARGYLLGGLLILPVGHLN